MIFSFASLVLFSLVSTSLAAPLLNSEASSNTTIEQMAANSTNYTNTTLEQMAADPSNYADTTAEQMPVNTTINTALPSLTSDIASPAPPVPSTKATFTGDGSPAAGWPTIDKWATFSTLLSNNQAFLQTSCSQFAQPNNSPTELTALTTAIHSISNRTAVDPRFILAAIMQESKGCVRVPSTQSPLNPNIQNPGLLQSHNGPNSCFGASPCPDDKIAGMVSDGVAGTSGVPGGGDGLQQTLAQATGTAVEASGAQAVYIAARIYNTAGFVKGQDLGGGSTESYASDVANRLLGVVF